MKISALVIILAVSLILRVTADSWSSASDFAAPKDTVRSEQEDGTPVLSIDKAGRLTGKKTMAVDVTADYRFSGKFRAIPDQPGGNVRIGLILYNSAGRRLAPVNCRVLKETTTELLEPAAAGSNVLKVNNATKWKSKPKGLYAAAMNARPDEGDLPNFEIFFIREIKMESSVHEIILNAPLEKDYPAGTLLRQHQSGPIYLFVPLENPAAGKEWTEFTFDIRAGDYGRPDAFWYGTAQVRPGIILDNPKGAVAGTLQLKELKLEKLNLSSQ